MDLRDKHVFITGASRGIGLAVAGVLAREGARVFLAALPPEDELVAARRSIDPGGSRTAHALTDVTEQASVASALDRARAVFGDIDLLINNAGVASQGMVVDQDMTRVEQELRVNYLGAFLVCKLALPHMLTRRRGMIVNVASTLARVPGPTLANYCASKAAIVAFSSALRSEVEDAGVDVRVFVPGLTGTGLTRTLKIDTSFLSTADEVADLMLTAIRGNEPVYICGDVNRAVVDLASAQPEHARAIMKDAILPAFLV